VTSPTSSRFAVVLSANARMFVRNRGALFFSLFLPILFMVIFGLIFGSAGSTKPGLGVVGSGPLVQGLESSNAVTLHRLPTRDDALARVRSGRYEAAVVVAGRHATLYFSNVYPANAAMLRGLVSGVADRVSLAASGRTPLVTLEAHAVETKTLKYIDFLVPGLLAMALAQSAVFGVAGTLVSFRERGIFRRLRVTPLPLGEFAFARVLTHLALAVAQAVILLAIGRIFFGVQLGLDVAALLPLVVTGALCFIAIGFFVGSVARSQDAAAAIANVVTLPMIFLAGVFFSLDTAPGWLQQVARVMPLTYLADGLRDVAIRGYSVAATLTDLGVLAAVAVAVVALSLRFFRWETA
jgi:ABC-2 type transport system permease protein